MADFPQDSQSPDSSALRGLLVVEFGARVAASAAGSLLAQLGATVVFVEPVRPGAFADAKWMYRDQFAAGKLSLAVDCGDAADLALLRSLAAGSDVLLVSSDADALAYGVSPWNATRADSVVCDITAFGSSGPLAGSSASDAQIQALSGIMECTGQSDGPPLALALPLVEQLAGIYAAAGVLAALRQRQPGQLLPVDIALYDVAFSAMTSFLAPALSGDADAAATRVGNATPWPRPGMSTAPATAGCCCARAMTSSGSACAR